MSSGHPNRCCPTDATAATCVYHPTGDNLYVAGPLDSKAGLICVSDIFGMLPNSQRLADLFASQGYLVVMPDFFGKKAWSRDEYPPNYDSQKWKDFLAYASDFEYHKPRVTRAVQMLHKMGCEKVGIIGLCWGAALSFQAAADGTVDSVCTAHPSFFNADSVKAAKTPVLVMPSMDEPNFDDVEAAVNAHPVEPHVYRRFDKIPHGYFGSRYDPDTYTPEQLEEVEVARQLALDFFKKTLH
ncbi:endo-1-like protein [Leptomonas pyrrhocoris]|uniref:Endo-1-like protein n=1 Tax=Leptomonas pyrrhocoris TaxID=157538 RepID=A0A0M9G3T9_LEPPY|nr:endo-1-like protein [Leptomonas pyrrhocoris]XP_015660290.1 endo-1-like protein [Leptomonas pyrrhocoris]KPA81850.1 endo-1-like protein [Leptomonas pyrrhocoris]KPA81851.1 endo-1-like protein [Leptomonas pyrrhocoris]|eukprot:XP_015660289.1 endo-1-like protein [Leptomonas pyrrhocoris]